LHVKFIKDRQRLDFYFTLGLISTIVFYLLKVAFWPLTYFFVVSFGITILLFLIGFDWKFKFLDFIVDFKPPLLLAGIFILELVFRLQFSNAVIIKDILLLAVLFSLFYLLYLIRSKLKKDFIRPYLFNLVIVLIVLISVLNLIKLFSGSILPSDLLAKLNISGGLTVANDYNFASLFVLFGLVLVNYKSDKSIISHQLPGWAELGINLIFIVNILLSGSKRAIIVLIILLGIYFLYYLFSNKKKPGFVSYFKRFIILVSSVILIFFTSFLILRNLPKQKIQELSAHYSDLSGTDKLKSVEKLIWMREHEIPTEKSCLIDSGSFNIKSKYWGYDALGTSISYLNTIYGNSINVKREKGASDGFSLHYLGPKILYYANHTYKISFKIKFIKGDFSSFNVGWWTNDGNKGFANTASLRKETESLGDGWYNCTAKYTFIDNHLSLDGFINSLANGTSFIISDFELTDLSCDPGLPRYVYEVNTDEDIRIWLDKNNVPFSGQNLVNNGDFNSGFAFWSYTYQSGIDIKIKNIDGYNCALISRGIGNGGDWSLYYTGRTIDFKANNEYQISFRIKPVEPLSIPFNVGFWVDEGEGYVYRLKLKIDTLANGWLDVKASYIFKKDQYNLMFPINSQIDNSQFYITGLSLTNLTQQQVQTSSALHSDSKFRANNRFSDRISRWRYASELWKTEYKWYDKIMGHGFDSLKWYGQKFNNNQPDWPHNPFISVLLYSGIFGLICYIWLLVRVVILYLKYRKKYGIVFICFLITFFFSFFSGSSPFDPPVMGFFILFPFLVHSIHKEDNQSVTEIY
jgi:hypothetical protein